MPFSPLFTAVAAGPQSAQAFEGACQASGEVGAQAITATATADDGLTEAILPRTTRRQVLGIQVLIDGAVVDPRYIHGELTVTQRLDGFTDFAMVVAVSNEWGEEYRWPIGNPWAYRAPAPGLASVDIRGYYVVGGVLYAYPLVTAGKVEEQTITYQDGVPVYEIRGLGPGSRYQRRHVTLQLEPAHGTGRLSVIAQLAAQAGVPSIGLGGGRPMTKQLDLVEEEWMGPVDELAELEGVYVGWDEDGVLTALPRLPDLTVQPHLVLDARDTLAETWRATYQSDVPTEIRLTTEEELSEGNCERVSRTSTEETLRFGVPIRARWQITGSAGSETLTALAPVSDLPTYHVALRVVTVSELECDTVLAEYVRTFRERQLETWRYLLGDAGAPAPGDPVIVLQNRDRYLYDEAPDLSAQGSEPAYRWPVARLTLDSEQWTVPEWDEDGWKTGEVVTSRGWTFRRFALKNNGTPVYGAGWDAIGLRGDCYTRGDGTGCQAEDERYSEGAIGTPGTIGGDLFPQITGRVTHRFGLSGDADDGRYIIAESTLNESAKLPPGALHLYASGETSATAKEQFGAVSGESITYTVTGEDHLRKTTVKLDYVESDLGVPAGDEPRRVESLTGYYPAAERRGSATSGSAQSDVRRIDASCRSSILEEHHPRHQVDDSVQYAEDEADLQSLCLQRLREGSLIECELRMPACFALRKGALIVQLLPDLDVAHTFLAEEVTHTADGGAGPILTTIKGRIRAI